MITMKKYEDDFRKDNAEEIDYLYKINPKILVVNLDVFFRYFLIHFCNCKYKSS